MLKRHCEILIAGGGLAGATAGAFLAQEHDVLVVDPGRPGSGSIAANGIVNPFMGKKARPVWMYEEALEGFDEMLRLTGSGALFDRRGVLRLASDEATAAHYRSVASHFPRQVEWLEKGAHDELHSGIRAPHGSLFVRRGGWIDVTGLLGRLRDSIRHSGGGVEDAALLDWTESGRLVVARLRGADQEFTVTAETLLVAVGGAFSIFDKLSGVSLHAVKGQTVRMKAGMNIGRLPHVAGSTTIGFGAGVVVVGSTYEHRFTDLNPDPAATRDLIDRARAIAPWLEGTPPLDVRVGVRATVPVTRNPVVGPLTDEGRVWILSGLGSRGLLMGAFLGPRIGDYLRDPAAIPAEILARRR